MMARALTLQPTESGWAVRLTDGKELVRYRGPFARRLALRYLQRYVRDIHVPRDARRR